MESTSLDYQSLDGLSVDSLSLSSLHLDPQESSGPIASTSCRPPRAEPILDRCAEGAASTRWLSRGLTAGLWVALVAVAGPLAWKGGVVTAVGLGLQRQRRRRPCLLPPPQPDPALLPLSVPLPVSRQELATSFRLQERILFRVRHARISEVSHDANGDITAIRTIPQDLDEPQTIPHAHPVS